jgi:O-methyltransferase
MKQFYFRTKFKSAIAKIFPDNTRWDVVCALPKIETWRKKYVGKDTPTFEERTELYDYLNSKVIDNGPIDYLEFGVYQGESLGHWVRANRHPDSRFYGFDTFTGLPENWKKFCNDVGEGTFDLKGQAPQLGDDRVQFIKGLFQDTVDDFLKTFAPRSQLVIHNDSDLYSSTLYVLTKFHDLLPGAIMIFDEFSSALNEFRALDDYCTSYRRDYEVLAVTSAYFAQVAIRFK